MTSLHRAGLMGNSCKNITIRPDVPQAPLRYFDETGVTNLDYAVGPATCVAEGSKDVAGEFGINKTTLAFFEEGYTASFVGANYTRRENPTLVPGATTVSADDIAHDRTLPLVRNVAVYFLDGVVEGTFTVNVSLHVSNATHLNTDFRLAGADVFGQIKIAEEVHVLESAYPATSPTISLTLPVGTTIWVDSNDMSRESPHRSVTFSFRYYLTQETADATTHLVALDTSIFTSADVEACCKNGAALTPETDLFSVEESFRIGGVDGIAEKTQRIMVYDNTLHYDA